MEEIEYIKVDIKLYSDIIELFTKILEEYESDSGSWQRVNDINEILKKL